MVPDIHCDDLFLDQLEPDIKEETLPKDWLWPENYNESDRDQPLP
jgi:hypothetical protein